MRLAASLFELMARCAPARAISLRGRKRLQSAPVWHSACSSSLFTDDKAKSAACQRCGTPLL